MKEEKAKKLANKYFKWWVNWLGLRYGRTDLVFVDYIENTFESGAKYINPDVAGECHTDWRYQNSTILLSIHKLCELDKEEIEKCIVHELMHVFLNEMREEGIAHEERVATNLQKAFFWVRDGVKEKCKKVK